MCVCDDVCVSVCASAVSLTLTPACQVTSCPYLFYLLVAARCLLWRRQVYWGSGVKGATECVRMFVSGRVYIRGDFRVCVYSERVFVRVCVSSYFRHSHHGRLFLVLKDSVCMHVYMSTGICTHCADACVCVCVRACVCVCVLAVDWRAGLGGCGEFVCSGPLVWKSSQSCASPWRESLI